MTSAHVIPETVSETMVRMPGWARPAGGATPEDLAFFSGVALACLDAAVRAPEVPLALLRDRLALRAATVCAGVTGRAETEGALRDAVLLRRPDDLAGPAGETYLHWRRAVAQPFSAVAVQQRLPDHDGADIARWCATGQGAPVARAAGVLEAVLAEAPQAETDALILAEAVLAKALGWSRITPVLAPGLVPRDLRRTGADLQLACHRAILGAAGQAVPLVSDLARRAARLRAVMPRLRARGAAAAVEMILARDAVTPGALSMLRSDRAARRFCDRLVALGVVHEMTGRDTARIYGL